MDFIDNIILPASKAVESSGEAFVSDNAIPGI